MRLAPNRRQWLLSTAALVGGSALAQGDQTGGDPLGSMQYPSLREQTIGKATASFSDAVIVKGPAFADDAMNVPLLVDASLKSRYTEAMERGDYEAAEKFKREPTKHMGPAVTSMERGKPLYRNGKEVEGEWFKAPQKTEIGDANRRIEFAAELGKIQREKASVGRSIIDTESSIADAIKERNSQFRDFLKDQRDNAGSRGTQKAPERHDWSHMRELAGARGTDRKNEREATPESIEAAIRGYAAQTGQQAPRNSLQERFGHLTKGQAQTEPEKRLEGPQREREAPQIITDPSAALARAHPLQIASATWSKSSRSAKQKPASSWRSAWADQLPHRRRKRWSEKQAASRPTRTKAQPCAAWISKQWYCALQMR